MDGKQCCHEYRAPLQAGEETPKHLRVAAADFSICDTKHELKFLGEFSRVPVNKGQLISSFKNMLVESFLSDDVSITKKPEHEKNITIIRDIKFKCIQQRKSKAKKMA